jgi:hypothetical protein
MVTSFNIAVLGPIPRDHIITYQGEVVEKYGCAVYTSLVLSALMGEGSRVVPVDTNPINARAHSLVYELKVELTCPVPYTRALMK